MKYCEELKKPISEIDHEECPKDCKRCEHCIECEHPPEKQMHEYWKE